MAVAQAQPSPVFFDASASVHHSQFPALSNATAGKQMERKRGFLHWVYAENPCTQQVGSRSQRPHPARSTMTRGVNATRARSRKEGGFPRERRSRSFSFLDDIEGLCTKGVSGRIGTRRGGEMRSNSSFTSRRDGGILRMTKGPPYVRSPSDSHRAH